MSTPAFGYPHPDYTACFSVHATVEPSLLPRVLAVFARRGMVPTALHSTVCGYNNEEIQIDIQLAGLDPALSDRLAESLRQIVGVECVLTSDKRRAMTA